MQGSSNKASLPPFDGPLSALSREETLLVVKIKPVTCLSTIHTKLKKKKRKKNKTPNRTASSVTAQSRAMVSDRPGRPALDQMSLGVFQSPFSFSPVLSKCSAG